MTALRAGYLHQRQLARTDSLTELYSRRAFEDRLEHDLALAQRRNSATTLAYLDLDNFKAVNDTYGHTEGDRVLEATGRVLKKSVRQADTAAADEAMYEAKRKGKGAVAFSVLDRFGV